MLNFFWIVLEIWFNIILDIIYKKLGVIKVFLKKKVEFY